MMKYGLLLLLLSGCAVGPDYQAPVLPLPAQYSNVLPDKIQASDPWWLDLQDAALTRLLEQALQNSPDSQMAEARIRQVRASFQMAESQSLPQVNASGRVSRDQISLNGEQFANLPFAHPVNQFTDYRAGFDASWELDLFGHVARSREAALARLGGAESEAHAVALRLSAEVAMTVVDYRSAVLRLKNGQALLADSEALLKLARLQAAAGQIAQSEVNQALSGVSQSAARIPALTAAPRIYIAALTVLTGWTDTEITALLAKESPIPQGAAQIPVGLPSDLLLRRPDIRLAERQLAAATADIGVAMAEQYPRFILAGNAGWDSIHSGSLTAAASQFWSFGPQLSLPVFSGGRLQAQTAGKEAGREIALAQYRKSILAALADTETALLQYQSASRQLQLLRAETETQQHQLTLARQRLAAGETGQSPQLLAHQQWLAAKDAEYLGEQRMAASQIGLCKALGGGWTGH